MTNPTRHDDLQVSSAHYATRFCIWVSSISCNAVASPDVDGVSVGRMLTSLRQMLCSPSWASLDEHNLAAQSMTIERSSIVMLCMMIVFAFTRVLSVLFSCALLIPGSFDGDSI